MARPPRRILPNGLYEVTLKGFQSRYFFIPSRFLNLLIVGVLAYVQRKYGLRVCYVVFLSNHAHLLIIASSAWQVSASLCLAISQISKEVQRLCGWTEGIFRQRCTITPVTNQPEAQIKRLKYLMSQGVKEGLVPRPDAWPGVQSATAWLNGSMQQQGLWVDRSELYELERSQGRKIKARRLWLSKSDRKKCETRLWLQLSPLPCLDDLSPQQLKAFAHQLNDEIIEENAEAIATIRKGWRKRLMNPELLTVRPEGTARGDRPKVHAASKEDWLEWIFEWNKWASRYESASRRLRAGVAAALSEFPEGSFFPSGLAPGVATGLPPPG